MRPEPFTIAIPDQDLEDLKRRLAQTRWPTDLGNSDWRYGVEAGWLQEMVAYWRDAYDWRAHEAQMNALPNFQAVIDGQPIHFLHIRGKGPNPTPLLLTHGWPWTFWDYRELIGPLTDPAAHGGDPADAFDLVIPSLPGFGFSPLRRIGVDVPAIAALWVRLMRESLGYERFAAAGGDWGAAVTSYLGHAYPEHLIGIFCTMAMLPGVDPASLRASDYAADEQWMWARSQEAMPLFISHLTVHSRDPQTLAYAMTDSPVGTAAWLWERRRAWSDCDGDVLAVFDRDALCTQASIYWLTGAIGTSFRLYAEQFSAGLALPLAHDRQPVIAAPAGFAIFPKELGFVPRAVAEARTNLKRWTVAPRGGHFAPVEQPAFVTTELREFFRPLRS